MIQNAVEQCWPEEELLSCYRFYLAVGKGEKAVAAEEKQERTGIAEQQIHAAKMARFALWDELADEEDEEEESRRGRTAGEGKGTGSSSVEKKNKLFFGEEVAIIIE